MDLCQMISAARVAITALLACMLFTGTANAQQQLPLTTGEEVAIAFFKTADTKPDYEKWAKGSDGYHVIPPTRADDYVYAEKQRLAKLWQDFNPDDDIFNIRSTITVHLKQGVSETGDETYTMHMTFEKDDAPYFPFVFQDYNFAVIPQKIDPILSQPLSKSQFSLLYSDFGEKMSSSAYLYLQMRASKAYIQQPYEIDDIEQWVLLADPVTLVLKSAKTGADLWTYGANWYVSPAKQEVRDLYQIPEKDAPVPQSP